VKRKPKTKRKRKRQTPNGNGKRKRKYKARPHHWWPNVTEQELTQNLNEDLRDTWLKLKEYALALGPQRSYASGKAIMFSKKVCYCFVRPMPKYLEVCFFLPDEVDSPLIKKAHRVSKVRVGHVLRLVHPDQVEEPLTDWIRDAFATTAESPPPKVTN
jgi:hypothetical protein